MYAEGLDRLLEHDLLLRNAQTVLAVELLRDLLGGDCAEQTAACTALGRNLDRALLELFRRIARCLLLEGNLACVRLVLPVFRQRNVLSVRSASPRADPRDNRGSLR